MLTPCPVAMIEYFSQKQLRGGKGSFGLHSDQYNHRGKAELEIGTMEEYCALTPS